MRQVLLTTFVTLFCLPLSLAHAVSCRITSQGIYNNPPGLHVDFLCVLDPQEVATLSHDVTRARIASALAPLPPAGPVLAVYVDQRIQQIKNGAGSRGAQIKATVVNGNFLKEFIVDALHNPGPPPPRPTPSSKPLLTALEEGNLCEITFDSSPADDHLGTIARGTPYTLNYTQGQYKVTGFAAGGRPGNAITATYPGAHPSSGEIVIFGARFQYTDAGVVTSLGLTNIGIKLKGKMVCFE